MNMQTAFSKDSVVVEQVLSALCWEEYETKRRPFDYSDLELVIDFLSRGKARHDRSAYSEAVTLALESMEVPLCQYTVIRALTSKYFKLVKDAQIFHPLDEKYWITRYDKFERETDAIYVFSLYHNPTMTGSSWTYLRNNLTCDSGSDKAGNFLKKPLRDIHQQKVTEVLYRILSGRL